MENLPRAIAPFAAAVIAAVASDYIPKERNAALMYAGFGVLIWIAARVHAVETRLETGSKRINSLDRRIDKLEDIADAKV